MAQPSPATNYKAPRFKIFNVFGRRVEGKASLPAAGWLPGHIEGNGEVFNDLNKNSNFFECKMSKRLIKFNEKKPLKVKSVDYHEFINRHGFQASRTGIVLGFFS